MRPVEAIRLLRPVNGFMMGLGVLVGAFVAGGPSIDPAKTLLGGLVGFLLNGAAMALNDMVDLDIDRINAPDRPLVTGAVSLAEAKVIFVAMLLAGLALSLYIGWIPLLIALASSIVANVYNVWGKKTGLPGNLMVAFTTAAPFLFGGSVVGEGWGAVSFLALLAFISNVGREVIKGVADVAGDSLKGVRTVAVSLGPRKASVLGAAFIILAVALSPAPYLGGYLGVWYLPVVLVADAMFVYLSMSIVKSPTPENARRVKNRVLYAMLLALLAFMAGKI